jgi:hypothetical protein
MVSTDQSNDLILGFVFVSVPPPKGENYAFSVPVSSLYSILVYPVRIRACPVGFTDIHSPVLAIGMAQLPSSKYLHSSYADELVLLEGCHFPRSTSTMTSLHF